MTDTPRGEGYLADRTDVAESRQHLVFLLGVEAVLMDPDLLGETDQ